MHHCLASSEKIRLSNQVFKGLWDQIWQGKCNYIDNRKSKNTTTILIELNDLKINPIQEGESSRFLGQEENIAYDGPISKERVSKDYLS